MQRSSPLIIPKIIIIPGVAFGISPPYLLILQTDSKNNEFIRMDFWKIEAINPSAGPLFQKVMLSWLRSLESEAYDESISA